jgi:hypothetical protein
MCGTQGRWHLNFKAVARKARQLYESRLGWQNKIVFPFVVAARKTFLQYGKVSRMQKKKNEDYSHDSRCKTLHARRRATKPE